MTTIELVKAFLKAYFVEHNPGKGLALVTEDIQCYGFADDQELGGIQDLKNMAASDVHHRFMDAELVMERENQVSEDSAVLNYSLTLHSTTIHGRIAGNSRRTPEGNKLYLLNNMMLNPLQTLHVYEDIARANRAELAKELLGEYISGGMMGGYLEPGFPFYFINDNMLRYLGYENEAEFVAHIRGLIENCTYEKDREAVNKAVKKQLATAGKYETDYRMLKKDGSYIWVHDVGKTIVAEDGRKAVLSAYYDITSEKEHERFLEGLVDSLNGELALFAVDLKQKCVTPLYLSDDMGKREGISKEEFLKKNATTGMDSVYKGDRQRVWDAICASLQDDAAPSISFRVVDKNGAIVWNNASFAKHGEQDGLPVILVLFTPSTMQNEMQLHALSQNGTGIAVIDADTHEVYFVNEAMFHMLGKEPFDYTNKLCPDILSGCGGNCENCGVHEAQKKEVLDKTIAFDGKWLSIHAERRRWNEKTVVSIYATDVTKRQILEQQLEKEDALLQGILHNMDCGVCVSDYDAAGKATITYLSDVFLKMCEADRETVIAAFEKEPLYGVRQEDIPLTEKTVAHTLARGGSDVVTYQYKTFKGNLIWVRAYFTVTKKPDGGCTLYFTCIDVSEQMQLKDQMRDLVENMPSAVCLYRWDGKKLHRLMAGYGYEELCGKAASKNSDDPYETGKLIVHPDDVQAVHQFATAFLQDGKDKTGSQQYRIWNEDKQAYIWITAHGKLVRQPDGSCLLYSVYTNESEQIELKNQLAATKTAVDAAVQYGQLGLWTYDLTTKTITQDLADQGAYGYAGEKAYTPEQFVVQKSVHEEDAETYRQCYQRIHSGAQYSECEARVWVQNKGYRWMHIHLVRQPDVNGKNPTAIGLSFDINQEVENYQKLAAAQNQLKQEKQVIDELFENLPGGLVMYRWNGKQLQPLYVSDGFSAFYGEDGEGVVKRANGLDFDVVHPDDLPGLQAFIFGNIEKTGQNLIYRYRVWNRQRKEYLWLQLTGNVKRQPDGTSIVYANYADVDAEVKAAEKIHAEEEILEATCRMAGIWTFRYDVQKKRIYPSKFLQESFDLQPVGENYPDEFLRGPVISEENRALYRQMVRKVDAGEDATTEMQVRLADGTSREVRFEWYITKKADGKAVEVAGLVMDIAKEVAERKRFDSERRKMLGGDKKLIAYSITDLQNEIILEAKDTSLDVGIRGGDTCKEFDAKVAPTLATEEDRARYLEMRAPAYAIRRYKAGTSEWTEDMRWYDGEGRVRWRRSVYSVLEDTKTGTLYLYCYLYDVMEEKVMQALFAGIQENLYLKTAVASLNTKQMSIFEGEMPNRTLKVFDYDSAIQEYIRDEVLPEDAARVTVQFDIANIQKEFDNSLKDFSFVHRARKDGTLYYRQVLFAPVPGYAGTYVIVVRDITELITESEQKNTELQKALAASNIAARAKSEFLSRMSHEIRTPMNAIMGMTAIARDNKSDYLQVSDCLNKIDSSSRYLLTLINDILEMSRIESGHTKLSESEFDFADLMGNICTVAEPLAKKQDIRLDVINETQNGSYYGDSIRIQQVIINLLGNSLKFTKESGRVRFVAEATEDTPTKTTFVFKVEDTGIGMSEAFMQRMFEPFTQEDSTTTSAYGGSGLGLAISKSLVEAMGGTITAESMVGIGTSFTVCLPLKKVQDAGLLKTKKAEGMTEKEIDAVLQGKRILMAEDHPLNVMVARKLLERKGVFVAVANNGKVAVDAFRDAAPDAYDAILMDIRMPVMDGLEATRQIRALARQDAKTVPIIAMTANALEEDRKNSKDAGMDEHLAKPIDPQTMYQILARRIARKTV